MLFMAKKLINDPKDALIECIEGMVETYPGLQYLDGFPNIKVVLRANVSCCTYEKVAVISGTQFVMFPIPLSILTRARSSRLSSPMNSQDASTI